MMRPLDWEHLPGRNVLHWLPFIALVSVANVFGATVGHQENLISLAGTWQFRLDPEKLGVEKKSNWNGIIGKIALRATDPVWIEDVQVYPDAAGKQARVRAVVGNITGQTASGRLSVGCESYNVVAPETWRQFCSETVPLFLMEKYTWTTDETFAGEIKIAHYGAADLPNARVTWTVGASEAAAVGSGTRGPLTIKQGEVFPVGQIRVPIDRVKAPRKLLLAVAIEGTSHQNSYDLWVYPPKVDTTAPANVIITDRLDAAARKHLDTGGKVLLFPRHDALKHCVKGAFQTDSWCWPMFAKGAIDRGIEPAPGTQGFLCDPTHPALAKFPTEFHSNWQW